MDLLQTIRTDLAGAKPARVRAVADGAGVNFFTFRKIVNGSVKNPRYETVEKLRAYYLRKKSKRVGGELSS